MITATATLTETISVTASLGGSVCLPATYTIVDTDTPPNTLGSGSIAAGAAATIVAPAATVTVNTAPFGTAPSGGNLNVPVVNGGANAVGSIIAGEVVIANNATFINGTQVTDQEAEVDANIFVTLNGVQDGTWNAVTQTWEVTGGASGSVSVAVSDSTPNFGDTITITATPTGLTPTSYLFFAFDGTSITFIEEQAGAVANWSVSEAGTFDVYAVATDGTINAWGLTSVVVADPLLICDLIATKPVWGVWMQRLTLDYTGPAGLVRRSSDNALLSINYIGKDWDLTALTNFVGVGNGFEVTLYDQFGSNNPTQPNAALQPACVLSGVVQYLGGKITVLFDGLNDQMTIPANVTFAHGFVLAAKTSNTNLVQYVLGGTGQGVWFGGTGSNFIGVATVGGNLISNVSDTNPHLASFRLAGGGAGRLNIDGVSNVTGTTSTSMTVNRIGTRPDNTALLHIGRFTGAIAYTSGLSNADWATIDNAIIAEYGL